MRPFQWRLFPFLLFLAIAGNGPIAGYGQLRNHSPYSQDRIRTDLTSFILHDNGEAEFSWASEWTQTTAQSFPDQSAIFVWHFRDGTKAYSRQGDLIEDLGKRTDYLLHQESRDLQDRHFDRIQPLTLANSPIRLELWIGKIDAAAGFTTELLGDYLCFSDESIEYNQRYHFTDCPDHRHTEEAY